MLCIEARELSLLDVMFKVGEYDGHMMHHCCFFPSLDLLRKSIKFSYSALISSMFSIDRSAVMITDSSRWAICQISFSMHEAELCK